MPPLGLIKILTLVHEQCMSQSRRNTLKIKWGNMFITKLPGGESSCMILQAVLECVHMNIYYNVRLA